MKINLILLFLCSLVSFWLYRNIKKQGFLWIAKGFLQIGILVLFIGSFFKFFVTLPSNTYIRLIFSITYAWCTIGLNVNFIIPLIDLIDKKIKENR